MMNPLAGGWIYNILPYVEQQALRDLGAGQPLADVGPRLIHVSRDKRLATPRTL